jgi:hypothetical protein
MPERRSLAQRIRRWWTKKYVRLTLARETDRAQKFALIHRLNYWGNAESVSGNGSSLDSTAVFRAGFEALLRERSIKKVFDAPCGDWNWMRAVTLPDGCTYLGADIVPALIEGNTRTYGRPGVAFRVADLIADPFPQADLWLCRDCLIHLSHADIARVLRNFLASGIPWMLVTSHPHVTANGDIRTGQYRDVNLQIAPFALPPPMAAIEDRPVGEAARIVGLWHRDQLSAWAGMGPANS